MPRSSTARWLHGVAERYLRPAEGLDPDDPAAVPSTALQRRGLVVLTREYGGWKGAGEYGQLVRRVTSWTTQSGKRVEHVSELPVALTVRKGELLPPDVPVAGHRGHRVRPHRHAHRAEPVRLAARERPQAVDDTGAPVPIAHRTTPTTRSQGYALRPTNPNALSQVATEELLLELRRRMIAPRDRRHNTRDDWDGLDPHGDWPEQGKQPNT